MEEKKQGAYEKVSLESINSGQAVALFDRELEAVLKNLADENTAAKAKREITIKIVIRPEENRESATVEVTARSTLAPVKPSKSFAVFASDGSKVTAYQTDPRQLSLGMNKEPENVVAINRAAGGE